MTSPEAAYLRELSQSLAAHGVCTPTAVIDRRRLDANLDRIVASLPDGMALRVVAKSLPVPGLLRHVLARAGSERVMTFTLDMLVELASWPRPLDQLLGKPLPVAAARRFLLNPAVDSEAAARVTWLVDSTDRLREYTDLAAELGQTLRVALEIDVGLHRGGLDPSSDSMAAALSAIASSATVAYGGLMGYEPHLSRMPDVLGLRARATAAAANAYQRGLSQARSVLGDAAVCDGIRNIAGSPTFRLYDNTELGNEVSVGSAAVKPTHFDLPLLADLQPAAFIATPALKVTGQTRLPGPERLSQLLGALQPRSQTTVFLYGGNWLATPVHPPGLGTNRIFGRSSNQEMLTGPASVDLSPDDLVLLRPTQSEAVLMQFPMTLVVDGNQVIDRWQPFPAGC